MPSMNKVILMGHLGKDPETRYLPNGDAVTNCSIATTRAWKDKTAGDKQEETEWHYLTFFGKTAEIAGQYLLKGRLVLVEGRIKTEKYTDKDGVERRSTKIICNNLVLMGDGGDKEGAAGRAPPRAPTPAQRAAAPAASGAGGFDDMDDDIPF